MKRHIVYIPGLGDRYDPFRRLGLILWRRADVAVTLVPMRWLNPNETYEQKLKRVHTAIEKYTNRETVIVGESAGGAVAIAAMARYRGRVTRLVTVCGMNRGASRVNPLVYKKNPAFRAAMTEADQVVPHLSYEDKENMLTIYSSNDGVVAPKDTTIDGVRAKDIKVPMHMLVIGYVLFIRPDLVINS